MQITQVSIIDDEGNITRKNFHGYSGRKEALQFAKGKKYAQISAIGN